MGASALGSRIAAVDTLFRTATAGFDPSKEVVIAFNTTSIATGGVIWTPGSGNRIAVSHFQIGTYGTTAARVIVWFGASGDTTYTPGTDRALFVASFVPSATAKPGAVVPLRDPIYSIAADDQLKITTDFGISLDIVVAGFEF